MNYVPMGSTAVCVAHLPCHLEVVLEYRFHLLSLEVVEIHTQVRVKVNTINRNSSEFPENSR